MCSAVAELSRKQCLPESQDLSSALIALYARSFLFFKQLQRDRNRLVFPPDFDVSKVTSFR